MNQLKDYLINLGIQHMNELQGKTISIYFSDYEIPLLNQFNELCKKTYSSKSGWVKRKISEEVRQRKLKEKEYETNQIR